MLLHACTAEVKKLPIVSKLADPTLIEWDNARVSSDTNIVKYAGKPFLKVSERDKEAEGAVNAYIAWKGGTEPYLPVKTAVENRVVEEWRAIKLSPTEAFIAGGAFQKPKGVIDQTWFLEPKTSRLKDGPQLLRARMACTLTSLSSGKVLISGGFDGTGAPLSDCECLDPRTQSISKFASLSLPRAGHTVLEMGDGKLLVVGGKTLAHLADSDGQLTSSIEAWSMEKNRFEIIGAVRKASYEPKLFLIDKAHVLIGKGHIFSGESETLESPPAEIYPGAVNAE